LRQSSVYALEQFIGLFFGDGLKFTVAGDYNNKNVGTGMVVGLTGSYNGVF
jgi:hypothetical protein